ncbi:hypothetical protein BA190_20880 [Labrys sp. WJW]|nr:hypothetical protein BA190_20880 [Labrys sp. WJW]
MTLKEKPNYILTTFYLRTSCLPDHLITDGTKPLEIRTIEFDIGSKKDLLINFREFVIIL